MKNPIAPYSLKATIIHFIYGMVTAMVSYEQDHFNAILLFTLYIMYQIIEMIRIKDNAFYEIREFASGYFTITFFYLIKNLIGG